MFKLKLDPHCVEPKNTSPVGSSQPAIHPSNSSDGLSIFDSSSNFGDFYLEANQDGLVHAFYPPSKDVVNLHASQAPINPSYPEIYPSLDSEINENLFDFEALAHVSTALSSSASLGSQELPADKSVGFSNDSNYAAQTDYGFQNSNGDCPTSSETVLPLNLKIPSLRCTNSQPYNVNPFSGQPSSQGGWDWTFQVPHDVARSSNQGLETSVTVPITSEGSSSRMDPFVWQNQFPQTGLPRVKQVSTKRRHRNHKYSSSPQNNDKILAEGCRKGHMTAEQKYAANRVRDITACVSCRRNKAKCSPDPDLVCNECKKKGYEPAMSLLTLEISCRGHPSGYADLFSPIPMMSHINPRAAENTISRYAHTWIDYEIEVGFYLGRYFPELRLPVQTFVPSQLPDGRNDAFLNGVPVAIPPGNEPVLRARVLEYIDSLVHYQLWPGHIPETINYVLEIIQSYCDDQDVDHATKAKIHEVLKLWILHLLMQKTIYMTEDSYNDVMGKLPRPPRSLWTPVFTRTLLNTQLLSTMEMLKREGIQKVLKDLEEIFTNNKHKTNNCALCVSIITIPCLCAEEVQVSLDGFHVFSKESHVEGLSNHSPLAHYSQDIERIALQGLSHNFHDLFNSHKSASRERAIRFNPVQDASQNFGMDFDPASIELATKLRNLIASKDHRNNLLKLRRNAPLPSEKRAECDVFHTKNSGTRVAGWLLSFDV